MGGRRNLSVLNGVVVHGPTIRSEHLFAKFESQFRPFVARLDIPDSVFARRDVEVSTTRYADLLEMVAREANPNIGLEMGERMSLQDLGVLGHAMAATATVGDMLAVMSKYLYVLSHSNTMRVDAGESKVACTYDCTILQPELVRQDAECVLSLVTTAIRRVTMRDFAPSLVEFVHARFPPAKRHRAIFGCEVKFSARSNRLHFNRKVLDYPVVSSDSGLLEALLFFLEDKLKIRSEEEDVLAKTRHLIANSLSRGVPDQKWIASQLGMSVRTLQRKIVDRGMVFSDLVDEVCRSIAMDYVLHSEYELTDISLMLGFGELSSFSRAFKRWYGSSPQQFRQAGVESE